MQGGAIRGRRIGPILLDGVPKLEKTLVIGIAVLHNEAFDPFRMAQGEPITDRGAVIHHVHRESAHSERLDEAVHHASEVLERVLEVLVVRHAALTVAGVVGRDNAERAR